MVPWLSTVALVSLVLYPILALHPKEEEELLAQHSVEDKQLLALYPGEEEELQTLQSREEEQLLALGLALSKAHRFVKTQTVHQAFFLSTFCTYNLTHFQYSLLKVAHGCELDLFQEILVGGAWRGEGEEGD